MFEWIQSLHDKLHKLDADVRDELSAIKARLDAIEAAIKGKTPEENKPTETPQA